MAVKDRVLAMLDEHRGSYFSGQELADRLGVTRAAVWKAIRALREQGYSIQGATNRGYALAAASDVLSADALAAALPSAAGPLRVEVSPCVDSTNAVLRQRAAQGEPEGLVVAAAEQTAGRGRMGRSFYSPAGTGLYMSVLLRPALEPQDAVLLTAAAAVAAARAADALRGPGTAPVQIKWVNDLWAGGKKVCGILTEASLDLESGGLDHAVLGLGFNLCRPAGGWPPELEGTAGGLLDGTPGHLPPNARVKLAAGFLREFWPLYTALAQRSFLPEYRARQALLGRTVTVQRPGGPARPAQALSVDGDCRLVVRYLDGQQEITALAGGEVRLRC